MPCKTLHKNISWSSLKLQTFKHINFPRAEHKIKCVKFVAIHERLNPRVLRQWSLDRKGNLNETLMHFRPFVKVVSDARQIGWRSVNYLFMGEWKFNPIVRGLKDCFKNISISTWTEKFFAAPLKTYYLKHVKTVLWIRPCKRSFHMY